MRERRIREETFCVWTDNRLRSVNRLRTYDGQRRDERCAYRAQVIPRSVNLFTLRVDDDGDGSLKSSFMRLFGQAFDAAESDELHVATELPTLSDRNGRANAGVGTWPKTDRDVSDFGGRQFCLGERAINQHEASDAAKIRVLRKGKQMRFAMWIGVRYSDRTELR